MFEYATMLDATFVAMLNSASTVMLILFMIGCLVLFVAGLVGFFSTPKVLPKPPAVFTDFENEVLSKLRRLPDDETLFALYDKYCLSGEDVCEWVAKNIKK